MLAWNGYGADGLKLRMVGSGSHDYYYAYDPQGSVANRIDPLHGDADTAVYDAYGNLQAEVNATTGMAETAIDPVGYSGQNGCYTDPETGLVLMTHRFYDPTQGRWLNRDPIGYQGGINLYGYCGNNPVTRSDPKGLAAIKVNGRVFNRNTAADPHASKGYPHFDEAGGRAWMDREGRVHEANGRVWEVPKKTMRAVRRQVRDWDEKYGVGGTPLRNPNSPRPAEPAPREPEAEEPVPATPAPETPPAAESSEVLSEGLLGGLGLLALALGAL